MNSLATLNLESLPSDLEASHQIIRAFAAALTESTAQLESLKAQVAALRRAQFGASSESLVGQGELFIDAATGLRVPAAQTETITYERERRGRPALPKDLPRVRVDYDLSEAEKAPFEALERIGEEKSETLDYIPAKLQVIEHVRAKYAAVRKDDGGRTVLTASMPPAPLPKSNASPSLLAHVLVSKYADHLPLNRIESIFRRHGVELARQTLCDWVLGSTELLQPVYEALRAHLLGAPKIHADDTLLPLSEQGRGRMVQARLWTYLGAGSVYEAQGGAWVEHPAAALFEFTDDRRGEHVQRMLRNYRGYLQADAYAGFNALYQTGRIIEVGCWAHYLECRFMRSSGSDTSARRRARTVAISHKSRAVRGPARTRAGPASVSMTWCARARAPHGSRRSASPRASSAGLW